MFLVGSIGSPPTLPEDRGLSPNCGKTGKKHEKRKKAEKRRKGRKRQKRPKAAGSDNTRQETLVKGRKGHTPEA
jgi:hypothetical protein